MFKNIKFIRSLIKKKSKTEHLHPAAAAVVTTTAAAVKTTAAVTTTAAAVVAFLVLRIYSLALHSASKFVSVCSSAPFPSFLHLRDTFEWIDKQI